MSEKCENCGNELSDNDEFCPNCGKITPIKIRSNEKKEEERKERKKHTKKIIKLSLLLIFIIVIGTIAVININDQFVDAEKVKNAFDNSDSSGKSIGYVGKSPEEIDKHIKNLVNSKLKEEVKNGNIKRDIGWGKYEKMKSAIVTEWDYKERDFYFSGTGYYLYKVGYKNEKAQDTYGTYYVLIDKNSGNGVGELNNPYDTNLFGYNIRGAFI